MAVQPRVAQALDAAMEALEHPIGLQASRTREPMRDAQRIEGVLSRGRALACRDLAVGERLTVIGQDRADARAARS